MGELGLGALTEHGRHAREPVQQTRGFLRSLGKLEATVVADVRPGEEVPLGCCRHCPYGVTVSSLVPAASRGGFQCLFLAPVAELRPAVTCARSPGEWKFE